MGERAEQLTGTTVLPMEPAQIRTKVQEMRDDVPDWIWDAIEDLEEDIRSGAVEVPVALTQDVVDSWRDVFG